MKLGFLYEPRRRYRADIMGKARKVAKSYSSMFVPDYPHAAESVADSDGFGSSVRVGAEDPCALKRKFTNLNVDGYNAFGGPRQIFSLSKMSQLEMKDLETRLKSELDQVRMLRRKIDSLNFVPSETLSYQNMSSKSAVVENFMSKKKGPERNGPHTKGGHVAAKKTESPNQGVYQNNFAVLMKECETLLSRLMTRQHAWIFNEPVDIVKHNVPDYFNVIKHPMDLGTVKKKLLSRKYSDPMGFAADVRLTFKNAMTYNPPGHIVHVMTEKMSKYFEPRWKPIEKKFLTAAEECVVSKSNVIIEPENNHAVPTKNKLKKEPCKKQMSDIEKKKLGEELEASWTELPHNILDFVKESILDGCQVSEDEIEIDFDTLSDDTLFTIRKLLDDYLLEKKRNQVKVEPCEIQIHNESKSSHLSAQNSKDRRPANEDVDIIGDDELHIPGENDKDAARKHSNRNSSSSSSDSGSSSSDSGSGSSAAELDVVNNSDQEMEGPILEPKKNDGCDRNSGDLRYRNIEHNVPSNSSAIEPNCRQEGESGLPGRQVSPEKLYRAALLRGRFADIIIKAQENTVEKGADPEKLKFEKEDFERRRRGLGSTLNEKKARLQAEAKAAEEARLKAEEEAAAEAKRKREAEREAARQALQKMEKTVDINESSQFMEDLGMFRDEGLVEDISPEKGENGLGSFKFPVTSNPLEQLGLYMKNEDDDEEEEVEIERSPDTSQSD